MPSTPSVCDSCTDAGAAIQNERPCWPALTQVCRRSGSWPNTAHRRYRSGRHREVEHISCVLDNLKIAGGPQPLPPIINGQNISKAFGAKTLFADVSFRVSETDRIGLIGPNGSAKSTLL